MTLTSKLDGLDKGSTISSMLPSSSLTVTSSSTHITGANSPFTQKTPFSHHYRQSINGGQPLEHIQDEDSSSSESKLSITPELHVISTLFTESQFLSSQSRQESEIATTSVIANTGILFDERLLSHENHFSEHPERPARISVIYKALQNEALLERVQRLLPRPATDAEILLAHEEDYLSWLSSTTDKEATEYEKESVYYNQQTSECSRLACGGAIVMASKIVTGELLNGFAIIRPPGHHAECNKAYGFCFINNVAVTAKVIQKKYGIKRILIVDWDVHHGNGTQNIFFEDPDVLYMSIHRYDDGEFFPCHPAADMNIIGSGPGVGRTVNIPWSEDDMGDAEYMAAFTRVVLPIAYEFDPELVIVSCGFDAAIGDPIGEYHVSPECYGHMTHLLMGLAGGKILLCLEGGYSLQALPLCATMCIKALLSDPLPPLNLAVPDSSAMLTLNEVVKVQSKFWRMLGHFSKDKNVELLSGALLQKLDQKSKARFQSSLLLSQFGLRDVFLAYWSGMVSEKFGLVKMPVPDSIAPLLDGDIFISSNVINTKSPIVVFIHSVPKLRLSPPVFKSSSSTHHSRHISNEDSFFVSELAYIEKAFDSNYSVIDILIKHDGHPVIPAHETEESLVDSFGKLTIPSVNRVNPENSALFYLWDSFLSLGISKNIFLVGSGTASSSISQLINQRMVENLIMGIISFPTEGPGIPVIGQKTSWYIDNSRIYVTSSEPFSTTIPFSRVYGTCVSNGLLNALDIRTSSIYATPFSMCLAKENVFEFISQKINKNKF